MTKHELTAWLGDKKILIWGFGREGQSTYRFLRGRFPALPLAVADAAEADLSHTTNTRFIRAAAWCDAFSGFDLVIKSPGIPTLGQRVDTAKLTSQTELFLRCFAGQTVGITGTKGKSTTSSLLYHQLKHSGRDVRLVGNIGLPCLDVFDDITPETVVVFELSCHQLEYAVTSPHVAVLLNLFEEHLDHYGSYENYVKAKQNIYLHQRPGDVLILNAQDKPLLPIGKPCITATLQAGVAADIAAEGRTLAVQGEQITIPSGGTALLGEHNLYNIGVVYYICTRLCGMEKETFLSLLKSFQGLPHRLQNIGSVGGVTYYDDSISTVGETTIGALKSVPHVGSLILGGMERGVNYDALVDYLLTSGPPRIILMPDTGLRIHRMLRQKNEAFCGERVLPVQNLAEAVAAAKKHTPQGTSCLFSPAAASYGFFKNFEERGEAFQALVRGE